MKKRMELTVEGFQSLTENEQRLCKAGGGILEAFVDAACFLASPALGLFNLGVKAGYRGEEAKDK